MPEIGGNSVKNPVNFVITPGGNVKALITLFLVAGFATTGHAAQYYLMKKMYCIGSIAQPAPKSMVSDYYHIGIALKAFKSKRRDGKLVDSLAWNNFYGKTRKEVQKKLRVFDKTGRPSASEVWYTNPLLTEPGTGKVFHTMYSGSELVLKVVKSSGRSQFLVGKYGNKDSVVGTYSYNIRCRAFF